MSSVNISFKGVGPVQAYDFNLPGIVLLHGMTSSQLTWSKFERPIANGTGRKLFTFDARNHGDSGWTEDFDYGYMTKDLENVMNNLHMPKATLIGHSMGGKTAMRFALEKPERVEKLIIEDITPKRLPPGDRRYPYVYIQLLKQSLDIIPKDVTSLDKAKEIVSSFMHDKVPPEHRSEKHNPLRPDDIPLKREINGGFQWQANLDVIEKSLVSGFKLSSELDGVFEGPTLFIYGTKSPYNVINDKEFILQRFPNASFSAIEGGGHSLHAEYPEEFTQKVIDFFNNS